MSEEEQTRRFRSDSIDRLAREVGQARRGGPPGQARIDRLAEEWPELAQAVGKVLSEYHEPCPEAWRTRGTPGSGRVIVLSD